MGTPPEFRKLNFRILTDLKSKEKNSNRKAKIKKMSISIKTILHRGPNEETLPRKEIRRFEIEENVNGSYDFLRAKIISLYPDMTLETPFRLMWTDEEGDNVCFSTDEELAQALKFVKAQENQLFKVIIKTPQVQQEQAQAGANQSRAKNNSQPDFGAFARSAAEFGVNFCRQFGDQSNAWNTNQMNGKKAEKMAQKMGKKCEKMKAKQQFHEEKARMLNEMIKNINPNMQQHIQALINGNNVANMTARDNGDVDIAVDIPINRSTSSSSTSTSTTTTTTTNTAPNTAQKQPEKMDQSNNVYPDLNQSSAPMEEDFLDVTEDVNRA